MPTYSSCPPRVAVPMAAWVMDFNNHRLRRIDDEGRIETVAGHGFHALADVTVPALESPLENPIDFDFLADGRVVIASYHDPRVLAVDAEGRFEVLAGLGEEGMVGNEGDGGDALAAMSIQLDGGCGGSTSSDALLRDRAGPAVVMSPRRSRRGPPGSPRVERAPLWDRVRVRPSASW